MYEIKREDLKYINSMYFNKIYFEIKEYDKKEEECLNNAKKEF